MYLSHVQCFAHISNQVSNAFVQGAQCSACAVPAVLPQALHEQTDTCHSAARPSLILGLGMCFQLRSLMHSWGCRQNPSYTCISESISLWVSFSVLATNLPFTVASRCKPTAVQARSCHWVTKLCVAITQTRTAVWKPKIPSQTAAAALTINVPATGALSCHLVTQHAQWALWVAVTCWKTPKTKLCSEFILTKPTPRWYCSASSGDGKFVICGKIFYIVSCIIMDSKL